MLKCIEHAPGAVLITMSFGCLTIHSFGWKILCYPCFIVKETEAQRDSITYLRAHSKHLEESGCEPKQPGSGTCTLATCFHVNLFKSYSNCVGCQSLSPTLDEKTKG